MPKSVITKKKASTDDALNNQFFCFIFRIITAASINNIPRPERNVIGSEKIITPTSVATSGSIVAIIPALPASTFSRPSV